ncbi:hypothetical protein [Parafrankia sp. EUN1f]|uniref:hypothetical protein n=1 Tax=Parafrankia sp. EUN1f TaxID=102897 RepID=UPI0002D2E11C|nr:hypothetical protein [Parafrankia sp. EUN1f]
MRVVTLLLDGELRLSLARSAPPAVVLRRVAELMGRCEAVWVDLADGSRGLVVWGRVKTCEVLP